MNFAKFACTIDRLKFSLTSSFILQFHTLLCCTFWACLVARIEPNQAHAGRERPVLLSGFSVGPASHASQSSLEPGSLETFGSAVSREPG